MRVLLHSIAATLAGCTLLHGASALAADKDIRDYVVVASRPHSLNIIDLQDYRIDRQCEIPGPAAPVPGTVVLSPDASIAYVLAGGFADVYGIRLNDCEVVFSTRQSRGAERVRSIASLAISPDGSRIYTHQNPVLLHSDHYSIQDTRIAVFDTGAGLDTAPLETFPAPRQVSIMATDDKGTLYLGGRDIYAMDPTTGAYEITLPSASVDDPRFSQRDSLTVWNIGATADEFIRLYSAAEYTDASQDLASARWHWGYERVDLATGTASSREFGPLDQVLFSGMTRPGHPDQVYAVLNNLVKFDAKTKAKIASQPINHSYYCINFTPDGSRIVLAGAANEVAVHDADTLEKLGSVQLPGDMSMASSQLFRASPGEY